MKDKKQLIKAFSNVVYGLITIFAIAALMGKYSIGGIKLLSVQSGSMEPAIRTGSLVVVKAQSEYLVSDIITYQSIEASKRSITHRIIEYHSEGVGQYVTKGDANDSADSIAVQKSQIIGKVVLGIPFLGYAISFLRSVTGLIFVIIIPAIIIIYAELRKIEEEAKLITTKRKNKPSTDKISNDNLSSIGRAKKKPLKNNGVQIKSSKVKKVRGDVKSN